MPFVSFIASLARQLGTVLVCNLPGGGWCVNGSCLVIDYCSILLKVTSVSGLFKFRWKSFTVKLPLPKLILEGIHFYLFEILAD